MTGCFTYPIWYFRNTCKDTAVKRLTVRFSAMILLNAMTKFSIEKWRCWYGFTVPCLTTFSVTRGWPDELENRPAYLISFYNVRVLQLLNLSTFALMQLTFEYVNCERPQVVFGDLSFNNRIFHVLLDVVFSRETAWGDYSAVKRRNLGTRTCEVHSEDHRFPRANCYLVSQQISIKYSFFSFSFSAADLLLFMWSRINPLSWPSFSDLKLTTGTEIVVRLDILSFSIIQHHDVMP